MRSRGHWPFRLFFTARGTGLRVGSHVGLPAGIFFSLLGFLSLSCPSAFGQAAPATAVTPVYQHQAVHWQIDVLQDGQPVDHFEETTSVGQATSATHHHATRDAVGCHTASTEDFDLPRRVDVSPLSVDPSGAVTLSIDSRQALQDGAPTQTSAGCTIPPQPRVIAVHHPGLTVPSGQPVDWELIRHDPHLVYRVSAQPLPPGP